MMVPATTRPVGDPRNGPLRFRRDLLAEGYTDRHIRDLVRSQVWARVREGVFVDYTTWQSLPTRGRHLLAARAVLGQAKAPLILSHQSAVIEMEGPDWGLDLSVVHATRTDSLTGRRGKDVAIHSGRLHAGDLLCVNRVPVMNPARAAIETIQLGRPVASLAVMNDFLHRGLITKVELGAQLSLMQTWPGVSAAEVLVRRADPLIESVAETRFHDFCHHQSLPRPTLQHEVRDARGNVVARLDFAWPDLKVWVEVDGKEKYVKWLRPGERTSDVVMREKKREDQVRELTGWRCLRVTWADLENPERLYRRLLQFLFPTS